jgi:hypothetical protein
MKLEGVRESSNVEDRRGQPGRGGRSPAGIGCFGLLLVLGLSYATGQDPRVFLQLLGAFQSASPGVEAPRESSAPAPGSPRDEMGVFVNRVLATTEDVWTEIFAEMNQRYPEPPMIVFTAGTRSGCGAASAAMGPFYCPADSSVYLDTAFFKTLQQRFGAPGDFAAAYVIAHEVGHHVQNVFGVSEQVQRAQQRASEERANALSVRLELQADCYAGVWGNRVAQKNLIEPGDFEEGMRAAASIGDDNIQEISQGYVQPESWTHGSGEQRQFWLRRGLQTGDPRRCDTFKETRP